jgi:hypothetical protein
MPGVQPTTASLPRLPWRLGLARLVVKQLAEVEELLQGELHQHPLPHQLQPQLQHQQQLKLLGLSLSGGSAAILVLTFFQLSCEHTRDVSICEVETHSAILAEPPMSQDGKHALVLSPSFLGQGSPLLVIVTLDKVLLVPPVAIDGERTLSYVPRLWCQQSKRQLELSKGQRVTAVPPPLPHS